MTVRELIAHLLDKPLDGDIFIERYGDLKELHKDAIEIDCEGDLVFRE